MTNTVYLPYTAALDSSTFYDKRNHSLEVVHHGRKYAFEGRFREVQNCWLEAASRITTFVLRWLWLNSLAAPVCGFLFRQKLISIYREKVPLKEPLTLAPLLNPTEYEKFNRSYDLNNLTPMGWDPTLNRFDLNQKYVESDAIESHFLEHSTGKFLWVVIPFNQQIIGKHRDLNKIYSYGQACLVPLAPNVTRCNLKFSEEGWLELDATQKQLIKKIRKSFRCGLTHLSSIIKPSQAVSRLSLPIVEGF